MYNRYIPQSDGTHHRRPVPQQSQPQPKQNPPKHEPKQEPIREPAPSRPEVPSSGSVPGFLRALLPREFDTGDLLVVLLLLLMAGDGKEDKSNALLTLALYFFM